MGNDINISCNWKGTYVMNPLDKEPLGYLVFCDLLKLSLAADTQLWAPAIPASIENGGWSDDNKADLDAGTAVTVVGAISSFSWDGGVGDPLYIDAYISSDNANQLNAALKAAPSTAAVTKLGWWICDYDKENKQWFERAFPFGKVEASGDSSTGYVQGQITSVGSALDITVSDTPDKVSSNIDVAVTYFRMSVIPGANALFALSFAQDVNLRFVRPWGLKVGTAADSSMTAASPA